MTRAVGLVLLAPMGAFAVQAFLGEGGFAFPREAWINTFRIASTATGIALFLGVPAALALAHARRRWPVAVTLLPLLIPPALTAAAWIGLNLGREAFTCSIILGVTLWPVVALLGWASLTRLPADQVDAARLQLSTRRMVRHVVWPHVRLTLLASAGIVFLLAASEFTVPSVFALSTVSSAVYEDVSAFRFASAAWTAMPLMIAAVALALPLRKALVLPQSGPARPFLSGSARKSAWVLTTGGWLLSAALLALHLVTALGSPSAIARTVSFHVGTFLWSAWFGLATAALLVAWASLTPRRSALEPLWLAGLVLPGIVPALGVLVLANRLGVQPFLSPVGLLLIWALMARFAIVAWLPLRDPVERSQLEAAELQGLSRGRAWRRIVLPALLPRAAAAGAVVFALSLGEVGSSVLLAPPGRQPVVEHIFNLIHYGYDETVASLALALMVGVALLAGWGLHVGRQRRDSIAA